MPRQILNFTVCLGNAPAKKNCQKLIRNLCMSRPQWLWYTSAFYQGLWFGFSTVDTTYYIYIILFTPLNRRKRRQHFSWSPCLGFFVCPCYNRRTHYQTLEKTKVSNANWVIIGKKKQDEKTFLKKITGDDAKKTKKDWLKYKF